MRTTDKTGGIVGALTVHDHDEIMLITVGGQMVRIKVDDVRETGRNTMGVKLVETGKKDKLQAIAPVISEENEDENEVNQNIVSLREIKISEDLDTPILFNYIDNFNYIIYV